jgi:hypothetical protein
LPTDSQQQLVAWVKSVSSAEISFAPPSQEPGDGARVHIYLLEMRGQLPLSPNRPDTRQVELGYLVTTSSADPAEAEQLLVDLCFAAMDQPGMDVETIPPDPQIWEALAVAPQASFKVTVPLRRRRREPEVKPVLKPLVFEPAALVRLAGAVRTSEGTPIPEARVEVPALDRVSTTDRHGLFRLDGVPRNGQPIRIHVKARGREATHELGPDDERSFVVITLEMTEAVHG